ncbi:MAG TPA: DUF2490 domain-containing protein [Pyrinomonadaceae bacterium]
MWSISFWSMLAALILLFDVGAASAQTRAQPAPHNDTQFWNDTLLTVPMGKSVDAIFSGTLRIGSDLSRPVEERLGLAFNFRLGKYLSLQPGYTGIWTRPKGGREGYEDRLSLAATLRTTLGKFTLSDRNTFERRYRSPQIDSTRYRNRLQIEHPLARLPLSIFASDEVFYDWSVNEWVRNRFAVGLSKKFNQHFTGELYYLRQNDGRTRPGDLHVIATTFRLRP